MILISIAKSFSLQHTKTQVCRYLFIYLLILSSIHSFINPKAKAKKKRRIVCSHPPLLASFSSKGGEEGGRGVEGGLEEENEKHPQREGERKR